MAAPVLHVRGRVLVGLDGNGADAAPVVRDELWVVEGRVTYDRPTGADEAAELEGWVLPGLVDAHCHVGLDAHGAVDDATSEAQAVTDRDAGALLLRDAGSPADTRWVDDREDLPRIVRAGRHVARTRRYIRNYADEVEPEQLPEAVRTQARRGDGWVKIVGDWIDRDLGELAPCWPGEALRAAVAAAHEEGARITAHCFGKDCLPDLLAAGVDGIEHGTGLTPETTAAAAERNVAVVPTLVNIATFPALATAGEARFPRWAAQMRALHERRYATVAAAHEAGVPLFVGTDAGGSLPHGLVVDEVAELVAAGLRAVDAVAAATWRARAWLGHPCLEEGAPADLLVLPGDPLEDVGVLRHPRAVVLRGRPVGTARASR